MVPKFNILHLLSYSLICVLPILPWTRSELFTAIAEVEHLLETHQRIIDDLDHFVQAEEKRLLILKKHLDHYKKEQQIAMEDIPNYLGNPINAFTLIKRLTTDLDAIESVIKSSTEMFLYEYMKNATLLHNDVKYPTSEDLSGAAHALIRLQETYRLDVKDLADGILNGIIYSDGCMQSESFVSTPMTTSDCYELARALYVDKDFKNALPWFLETHRKYTEGDETYYFDEVDILEYIGFAHYLLGNTREALEWTKKLLEIEPDHPRAKGNIPHFEKIINEEEAKLKRRRRGETLEDEGPKKLSKEDLIHEMDRVRYESLCRGEMELPYNYSKRLFCRYMTENHPFLKLAPLKMEYLYREPDIILFHEVMSDSEIEFIKAQSLPKFKRAVVHDPKTGQLIPANYRISKSAWLRDELSPVIATVSRRVADMTALSMDTAEELQVVNYGIGGHYDVHYDFARHYERAFEGFQGNRIATVLFYMSEVAQGGATVFTRLGISVFPVKGAALFWMNLHPSGAGDLSTRHAACPVLRGSKWVCNKWIHQGGQELLKPCNLEYQSEEYLHKIPKPILKSSR